MPPHRGHQFLIDFARAYAERVTILVCTLERDPIPGRLRYEWVCEMAAAPNVDVVHVDEDLPQSPADHPQFWEIWQCVIGNAVPGRVDYFFACEDYGPRTAEVIGDECRYVPVDPARALVPISASAIRGDPLRHWEFLPEAVRPYYVRRVCIFGPESTGKSTLARDLAREFKTVYAHEYARPLLDPHGGQCRLEDIPAIVRGQVATEEALARQANRVLFCDTDVLTTTLWSDVLFKATPDWIQALAERRTYDLYLLLDVDVPWVDDSQRFFSAEPVRRETYARFRDALERRGRPCRVIRGDWNERLSAAIRAVRELL